MVWRNEGRAAAAVAMALSVSALSNSGHVPINLPVDGSTHSGQWVLERLLGVDVPWASNVLPDLALIHSPLT